MLDSIMNRRSIRKFEDRPVEREKLESILRAAMQSPTAKDSRCWEFLVVTDREDCEAVSKMSEFAMCAAKAPALIIPMVNLDQADREEGWWVEDLSAATQTMLIQIEAEGLGATWLGMYPRKSRTDALSSYFQLPEHILPFAVIALGYKAKEKPSEDRWDPEKVHWGSFS
jgi:nitroreductase